MWTQVHRIDFSSFDLYVNKKKLLSSDIEKLKLELKMLNNHMIS